MPVTNFVWDGDQYLMETDETNTTQAVWTNEPDAYTNLVSQRRDGASHYAHFDGLGSTRELTDASETVTDDWNYDAWGIVVSHTGTTEFPFQFVGKFGYFYDSETDSFYVIHRVYEPKNGRWWSCDPLWFIDSVNLYKYANDNPISKFDFNGQQVTDEELWLKAGYGVEFASNVNLSKFEKELLKDCKCTCTSADSAIKQGAYGYLVVKEHAQYNILEVVVRTKLIQQFRAGCGIADCVREHEEHHLRQYAYICSDFFKSQMPGKTAAVYPPKCFLDIECMGNLAGMIWTKPLCGGLGERVGVCELSVRTTFFWLVVGGILF